MSLPSFLHDLSKTLPTEEISLLILDLLVLADLHGASAVRGLALKVMLESPFQYIQSSEYSELTLTLSFWPFFFAVYCGQWEGNCCSARVEREIEGLIWRDGFALIVFLILHLQAYPEIMADMFEAMTRQPAKRQRLNWEKLFWVENKNKWSVTL